jgi:tetratricopeptide (TPR) repeat protein
MMKKETIWTILAFFFLAFAFFSPADAGNGFKEYNKGLTLYHKGHYEDALELFQQAIDENLEFWQAYQMSGYCHFELRHKEDALKSFEESLDINPRNTKLTKIYQDLKTGKLDIPLRPVATTSTYYAAF